jgi:hypothetical protein
LRNPAIATLLVGALLATALPAVAQMKSSGDVVAVKPARTALSAAAGERIEFEVKLDIERRWHLYAHGDTNFIGVDLVPDEGFPLSGFVAAYPEGHEKEFFGEKLFMLEGKNVIKAAAQVPAELPAGEHVLDLKMTVQACDDKVCLPPAYLPVRLTLQVE